MKRILKILLIVVLIISASCREKIKQTDSSFDGSRLKKLIEKTLHGEKTSSNELDGLFTFISSDFKSYNKLFVDSILIDKKTFYSILIENQNPIYNLFAIIDSKMSLLLKDESLNGYLKSSWKKSGSKILAVVEDDFISKDVIKLNRISYYSLDSLCSDLVFRQFIKIKTPESETLQNIVFVSDTSIKTEIVGSNTTSRPDKDVFRFDVSKNRYLSKKNRFETLVISEINLSNIQPKELQIADAESIRNLLGINQDTVDVDSLFLISNNDFTIKLDNQWKKLGNYIITDLIKKEMKGFKFINTKIGAGILMFKIAANDSAEHYFDKASIRKIPGNDNERISEIYEDNRSIFKLYEYSCPTKKLILILETPQSTYQNYLDLYSNIFKSFKIKC